MSRTIYDRLAVKTPDQRFRYELETGFELAPKVAEGVLELAKSIFDSNSAHGTQNDRLRPGQIRQIIAASGAPHGCSLRETEMVEVVWTIDAGEEDLEVLQAHGPAALRRVRILRLVDEALNQGGEPTQEDLGKALGVTARTIRSDIATLKAEGYQLATRGNLCGTGRGQTHKVLIVELHLKRHTYSEIMRLTRHSASSIKRYLQTFGRAAMLNNRGLSVSEIAFAVGISERLVMEHLDLYRRYNVPEYQDRLEEIEQMVGGGSQQAAETPKRGVS